LQVSFHIKGNPGIFRGLQYLSETPSLLSDLGDFEGDIQVAISLIQFSTGHSHPLAANPIIILHQTNRTGYWAFNDNIKVMGNILLYSSYSYHEQSFNFYIIDWRTGEILTVCFLFLSSFL
jgi:hypothetical protein